ncbi:MAG TPA: hypothetical protein VFS08_06355 [Gemmatimonadaceae bacterium]|nr:hypothetical protein [Gemmatimonadaceae bacterium]
MRSRRLAPAALVGAVLLAACDLNEYLPTQTSGGGGGGGGDAFSFTDPMGDLRPEASAADAPDALALSGSVDGDTITIRLVFRAAVARFSEGRSNSLDGFVDLDVDENATTGIPAAVDEVGGATGMGADFYVDLRDATASTVTVLEAGETTGTSVPATFGTTTVTIRVPRTLVEEDDGRFRLSALVGNPDGPSDFVPNSGFLTVGDR